MIYIIRHNECAVPLWKGYKVFSVGTIYKGVKEDINRLNPYINEVTALADLKEKDDEIIGLVHYHRFFKGLSFKKATEILNEYDVITSPDYEPSTPYEHLMSLDKALVDKYLEQLPDEIQKWFHEHHGFNICNMFVAKKQFLVDYVDWLYPMILPLAEQFMKEDVTDSYRRNRTLGFICECLFGYYCKDFKRYKNQLWEIN